MTKTNPKAGGSAKNLITQGSILVASSFLVRLMNVFYRIPVTNLWGDRGLGTYGDAYQVYAFFLVFASISIPTTLSKLISERMARGQSRGVTRVVRCAFALVGGIGFVCMVIMMAFAEPIAIGMYHNPQAVLPIRFLGPTVFVVALMSVLRGYFQGLNDMTPTAVSEVIEGLLHAVFSVILAYLLYNTAGLTWSVTGGILGTLTGAIGGILFLAISYVIYKNRHSVNIDGSNAKDGIGSDGCESYRSIMKQMLSLMVPIVLSSSAFSIKGILDSAMFGTLMIRDGFSQEMAVAMRGIYTGKFVVLINLPISIGDSFGAAAVPAVAGAYARKDREELKEQLRTIIKTTLIIAIPCAIGMMVLGKPFLKLMFPGSYLGGELFWVGGVSVVFYCLNYGASGVLSGLNKPQYPMYHVLLGVLASCILNVITIRVLHLGIFSLALNSTLFSLLLMVLNMRCAMKLCEVKVSVLKESLGPLGCALIMGLVCVAVYMLSFAIAGSNALSTVLSVVCGVAAYFILLVNLKAATPGDLEKLPGGRYLEKLRF
ncbi:MAG: polysaccharide biosynthesis protein [Lachnospiraceae bacterium]|nr:polysaccharide biosynthesis protein [Lachnospiraceae bacterium]